MQHNELPLGRSEDVDRAVSLLRAGEVVGIPTETVYGLAADGLNPAAVARIFRIKGRPSGHPVILHVDSEEMWLPLCEELSDEAHRVASAFWPGPLTMIVKRSELVPNEVTGGLPTVGLRMPSHPLARELLRRFGRPLAAPSANRFGCVSPTMREHVLADLGSDVPLVLDGGPCQVGVESTIIDASRETLRILRHGAVSSQDVLQRLGIRVEDDDGKGPRAPGTLASHYAPRAKLELVPREQVCARARELSNGALVGVLLQGDLAEVLPSEVTVVRVSQDAVELARELYQSLRAFDAAGCQIIVTHLPEAVGVGRAVADRLERAATERSMPES